jgi:hypothetical protein
VVHLCPDIILIALDTEVPQQFGTDTVAAYNLGFIEECVDYGAFASTTWSNHEDERMKIDLFHAITIACVDLLSTKIR